MQHLNTLKDEYILKRRLLSSLVLNPLYGDGRLDTSPKVTRIQSLPFGIKLDSVLLSKFVFSALIFLWVIMGIGCFVTFCISLPLQAQNIQLVNKAKSVANSQLGLTVKLQEVTSSKRLFTSANLFSMKEPEEIIRLNSATTLVQERVNKTNLISTHQLSLQDFRGYWFIINKE
jgi:hypothetical protein